MLVDIGDHVEKDQVIARLDQSDLRIQLERAEAAMELARLNWEKARRGYTDAQLIASEERLRQLELEVADRLRDYEKQKNLLSKGYASEQAVEDAQYAWQAAKLALEEAEKSHEKLLSGGDDLDIKIAWASYRQARAAYNEAEKNLGESEITSPMKGTVLVRHVNEGSVVASSLSSFTDGTPVVSIGAMDNMEILSTVDETDIGNVRIGQPVRVEVDAFPDEEFRGTVKRIAPQGDTTATVTTFLVKIDVENPEGRLLAGLSTSVSILVDTLEDVLLIPDKGIIRKEGKLLVKKVTEENTKEEVEIEIGKTDWTYTEVTSGLEEGDRIVVDEIPEVRNVIQADFD
jgi:HlyD family secretion protein